ncbi:hypothetical protein ACHQM5_009172 [Ranunculus cassubicifolius]
MEGNIKKVMVAIDETEWSLYALEWVLDNLADSISSSSLVIFTAQPQADFGYFYAASLGSTPPELIKSMQEQHNKVASALLKKAKDLCVSRGVTPETVTEVGDPKEAICEAVAKFNIHLLVLGNQGKGIIQRTFLGSVSSYCAHHVKCPVLIVKKPT